MGCENRLFTFLAHLSVLGCGSEPPTIWTSHHVRIWCFWFLRFWEEVRILRWGGWVREQTFVFRAYFEDQSSKCSSSVDALTRAIAAVNTGNQVPPRSSARQAAKITEAASKLKIGESPWGKSRVNKQSKLEQAQELWTAKVLLRSTLRVLISPQWLWTAKVPLLSTLRRQLQRSRLGHLCAVSFRATSDLPSTRLP